MRTRLKKGHYQQFSSRLKFILTKITSQEEFIELTGITAQRINELLDGADPSLAELNAIVDNYRMLVEKWILTGVGIPLRDNPEQLKKLSDYSGVCERFRMERINNDYTQEEWGKIFGRARATIAAIETNRQVFPFDVLRIWHKKFNRSYAYILDGVEEDVEVPKLIDRIEKLEQDKENLQKSNEFLQEMLRKK